MADYYVSLDGKVTKKKKKKSDYTVSLDGKVTKNVVEDIAPVISDESEEKKADKKRTWFDKGAFDDGYQFGDVTKSILGSSVDALENVGTGIIGMGEKVVDAFVYLAPYYSAGLEAQNTYGVSYTMGSDHYEELEEQSAEFIKKDLYDASELARAITTVPAKKIGINADTQSNFGEKSASVLQSGGQLVATAGLQAVGVPWYVTTGATAFGGEVETALKEGANYQEAGGSAFITAGAEILTEKLSGGIKFGGKTLDDVMIKPLTEKIASKTVKQLANVGIDAAGEGSEEVISSVISNLGTSLYKEENLEEILASEEALDEYIESFIGGAVLGGGMSTINTIQTEKAENKNTQNELTENEQKVVEAEVENRIKEAETDEKTLTNKEKSEIREQVISDLDKGNINLDTIERVLGGETYESYKSINDKETSLKEEMAKLESDPRPTAQTRLDEIRIELDEIGKGTQKSELKERLSLEVQELTKTDRLSESYKEKARRSQKYEADLTKYDAKQQETVKRAVESGILNNTNKTHDFVDLIAKLSAEKGVLFDFTNNENLKKSGFAVEGATVNGLIKGKDIILNIDSAKALNTVVGHEITHVLEGTNLYKELQKVVKEYATTKGEYDTRLEAIQKLYKGKNADIDAELTADLVGDYLFTDSDFINNLSTVQPNIFKKIYEEIKYLYKLATAGSKEARQLEKVKRTFDKAFKENTVNRNKDTSYHISSKFAEEIDKTLNGTMEKTSQVRARDFTPSYLVNNGAKDLPMLITQKHIKTIVYTEAEAKKLGLPVAKGDNYHGLGKELLVKAIDNMDSPSAVYKKDANNFIIITELTDSDGNTIIVPVRINGRGAYNNVYIDENHITSVYGKKNLQNYLTKNNFTEVDIKEGTALNEGVQYSNISDSSINSIPQNTKNASEITKDTDAKYSLSDNNIKEISTGYGYGETYFTMSYMQDGKEVAKLDYGEYDGIPNVKMIEVNPEYRRKGIGTKLLQELQKKYPDKEINFGMSTPDGTKLLENVTYDVTDEAVVEDRQKLKELQTELNELQEQLDVLYDMENLTEEQRVEGEKLGDRWTEVYDTIRELEQSLRGKRATKTFIKTDTSEVQYSLSEDSDGHTLSDEQKEYFKDSKIVDENGQLKVMYHGSPASFTVFDKKKAKSSGYYGRGFYFSESESHAGQYGSKYEVYLNIKNPMQEGTNDITKEQLRKFVDAVAENEDYGIENYGYDATVDSVTNSVYGKDDFAMIMDINATSIGDMVEAIQLFNEVNGTNYDGIVVPTETVAFYPNQIKSITNQNPTDNPDINLSLSEQSRNIAPVGSYNVYGKDIGLETPEKITEIPKNSENNADLVQKNTDLVEDYAPLTEEQANERDAMQSDRIYTLDESYMPDEVEAPYNEPVEAVSPFDEKDIKEVGDRKQKAYMYENPEVKPYFQEEAQIMLGELRHSIKGEKQFNSQLYYDSNGEQGWFGMKRETSDQIAYLLDRFKYTYADIEKGLNAIIKDHGAENNAISKRLEFMIDERLREGYTDFLSGMEIPSNQDYINLLTDKQINEYSDEAYNKYLESLAYAEPTEEVTDTAEAPVDEMQVLYSLSEQQQEKVAEADAIVEAEDSVEPSELPTVESYDEKLENYKKALEGYKTAKATIETSFDNVINKKTAEYNALKRKDTKKASTLLMQIETLKLRKNNNITTIDSKITKVETTIEKMADGIPTKRQIYHRNIVDNIKSVFSSKGFNFDKVLEKAKNKSTFASVDNTPQRFIEKTLGYKEGQILNDLTVNKVAQNESKAIKWLNSYTDKKSGLLAKISKEYGIKPRSKESASAQMYAEGFWVDDDGKFIKYGDEELAKDFPDAKVRENIKKLAKDERVRKIYDETLKMINESRKRNLYPEIPRRNNYFLHFREMEDTFSKLGIPFNPNDIKLKDLPTDINGMTADLQPGQPYFASAKQRLGYKTTYDLIGGVERYLNSAKNQIYHIDDIQNLRALRNYIADTYGQAKGLESLDAMTEEEAVARIEEVYNSHLSTFAKFLNEEANVLAGKTSLTDRGLEGVIGRRGIQFLDTVNRQVGANMIGFNLSSAMTNTVSMVQAVAKSNKFDVTKAFAQTVKNKLGSIVGKTDGFVENNPMMIRRKGVERLTQTPWESIADKGYILMSAVDSISSEFIARTKFNELTRKGMSEQQAHIEADKWASRVLGDRSLGQQPQLYNSKMLGLVTKFQLEVRNQLDSQFYDTIQEAKVSNEDIENRLVRNMKTSAKIGSTFFQLAVLQHLFGKAFESVAGYNPAFDIVEVLIQMLGLDDEEESEDTVLDNLEEGFLTLLGDLPYTSTFTGGRIPIESALPIEQFVTGKDDYGNDKSRLETLTETAPYYLMPGGYNQIKKTTQGLGMFNEEHPVSGSYTDSGNLRFPVEDTPLNRVQAGVFGQWASENARDYFDNERSPLKEKQIQEYADLDIPIKDYWEYREGLSEQKTLEEKFDYIAGLDLPVEKKNIMINNVVDRKEDVDLTNYDDFADYEEFDFATKNAEKYEFLQSINVSYKDYIKNDETKEAYNWAYENPEKYVVSKAIGDVVEYRNYAKDLNDIKADKDENGKSINGSRKAKVVNYISGLQISYEAKLVLLKSEYNADDTYNYEIIEYLNSRNDISYSEAETILKELGFIVEADGTIRW